MSDLFPQYTQCALCPRCCGVDRNAGGRGFCGEDSRLKVASIGAHFGEEPPLVGATGSGTVFFSGCSTGCFFCQNYQLSTGHMGEELEVDGLVARLLELAATRQVCNFNLVTPEHFWPHIRQVITQVREAGCDLPFVWNSSGYSRLEMLQEQSELVDIFLPDFKYALPELAQRCMGRRDYPQVALEGITWLVDRLGFLRPFDESGEMTASRGVLVRHLVLPGEVENSRRALEMLLERFGSRLPLSVMGQFRPMPECHRRGDLDRMVTPDEYSQVVDYVQELGFERVFIQPDCGDPGFVPDFTCREAPFQGNIGKGNQAQ